MDRPTAEQKTDFHSNRFGPFSPKIYAAADTLVAAGLLRDSAHLANPSEDQWEAVKVGSSNGDSYRIRAHRDAINALRPVITGPLPTFSGGQRPRSRWVRPAVGPGPPRPTGPASDC